MRKKPQELMAKDTCLACLMAVLMGIVGGLHAQTNPSNDLQILRKKELPPQDSKLSALFSQYQVEEIDPAVLYRQVTDPAFDHEVTWQIGGKSVRLALYPHDIRQADFQLQILTESGVETIDPGTNTTYRGWNLETGEGDVRLTITPRSVSGFVTDEQGAEIYLQPASDFGATQMGSSLISYRASDVLSDPNKLCGSTHRHEIGVGGQTPESHSRSQACMQAEVAIAADYSMYTKYGQDVQALSDHLIGIKNLMEPNYSVFNVEFSVVTVYVVTNPGGDPWTSGTDPNQLLDDFCCWAGTGSSGQLGCTGQNGFGLTHDVGELWTNRDFTGSTVGLAWIGTICSGMFRYSVDQHYTTSQQSLRVLIAHECGHNFGANHDGSGSYIMAPSVNPNATQFSSTSQSAINAELPGYTCMGSCVPDCPDPAVDMEIVSLSAGDCGSSQYDLTVVVTHGGGNGSGFNVNIDGTDHFRSFSSSPQTVVISNLSATGQSNVPVSVAAVTSGAPGCNDAATFNAPSANCGYEEVVDFNDCALPPGWSESTTNLYTFTINGVADPEWQYEWKFDNAARPFVNYNEYENANSLLTIDGTCMALFDDDISSLTEYSGVNTLTTKAFDITDFENNILSFDYNFNNFEEGKSANGSYFQVQVWDGSGWVQVLYDDNDACPWTDVWSAGCTTSFSVAVDAYRSSAFKVRFIYSDGDDGEWTGMVALDNFRLTGDVINTGPCNQSVTITPPQANGLHQANLSISTSGNIVVTSSATYNAPINVLNAGFEVANGAVFEVKTGGCE